MANGRIPGPLGIGGSVPPIDKGTSALTNSARPGPLGIYDARTADEIRQEQLKIEIAADIGQLILDITGIIDPTPASDGTNALISLARGRWVDALINTVSIIPYIGDVSKLAKLPRYLTSIQKAVRLARVDVKWAARLREIFVKVKKLLDDVFEAGANNLPAQPRKYLQQIRDEIDAFLNPGSLHVKPIDASSTTAKSSITKTGGTRPGNKSTKPKKPKEKERSQSEKELLRSKDNGGVVGAKNKALELEAKDGGHSIAHHGPDVSDKDLKRRLETGIAPDGKFSPTRASTRFKSHDEWLKTREDAIKAIETKQGIDLSKPPKPGEGTRHSINMDHGRDIDDGFVGNKSTKVKIKDAISGKKGNVYPDSTPVSGITRTQTTVEWNPKSNSWEAKQHYPDARGWNQSTQSYIE